MRPERNFIGTAHNSILELDRQEWDECFAGEIEGYDHHAALERASFAGFALGWYAVRAGGKLVCAAPTFRTKYDLLTTVQDRMRDVLGSSSRHLSGWLTLGLSCLGSPEAEHCQIGFHHSLNESEVERVMEALLDLWECDAQARGFSLFGIKDLNDEGAKTFGTVLSRRGYRALPGLPGASLPITFSSFDAYLMSLSPATRKDLRRKLRKRSAVTVEIATDIEPVLGDILEMYRETRARSDWEFEDLSGDYFREMMKAGDARFILYRAEGQLVAANLIIEEAGVLLDKYFLMREGIGRELNLYFLSWANNIERCIERGFHTYAAGAAAYETKLRLGCQLQRRWLYFRHRRKTADRILRAVSPLLAVDQPAPVDARCWGAGT